MEEIRDKELNIAGERYRSFLEAYRENDARVLNAVSMQRGDGDIFALAEVKKGVLLRANETREALLYGSNLFQEEFQEMRLKATTALKDRYEWREVQSADTSVHGQNVIVERFMAGHPEAFRRALPKTRKKRSVHIVYDSMCAASTSVRSRVRAGCAVMAAVEALERIGYEVAVSFALAKYSGRPAAPDPTLLFEVSLKDYGEPFNEQKMQFPLASKSVLFHLGCWWAHRFPRTPMDYGVGEGYPLSYDKGRVRRMEAYAAKTGGAYLSEDIIEISLHMDPVKVLQRVLGAIDAEEELVAHLKGKRPMGIAAEPEQGKIFHDWSPQGMDDPYGPESIGLAPKPAGGDGDEEEQQRSQSQDAQDDQAQETLQGDTAQEAQRDPASQETQQDEEQPSADDGAERGTAMARQGVQGGAGESSQGCAGESEEKGSAEPKDSVNGDRDNEDAGGASEPGTQRSSEPSGAEEDSADDGNAGEKEQPGNSTGNGAGDAEDDEDGGEENATIAKCEEEEEAMPEITSEKENAVVEEPANDEFIIALRKRFVSFENGDYLNAMIEDKMSKRRAAKAAANGAPVAPRAPMAPGFNPNGKPDDPGFRAFAAFACK